MFLNIKNKFFILFLFVLVFDVVFDPANKIFGAKSVLFFIVLLLGVLFVFDKKCDFRIFLFVVFFNLISIYGLIIGLCANNHTGYDINAALSLSSSFVFFSLILVLYNYNKEFNWILIFVISLLSVFIIFLMVLLTLREESGTSALIDYFNYTVESAKITYRKFGFLELPMVYYKTAPLILVGISALNKSQYTIKIKSFINVLFFTAMMFSGTRANILMGIFVFSVLIYANADKSTRVTFLILGGILLFNVIPFLLTSFFSSLEPSNVEKMGHIFSYLKLFSSDGYLFVGDGFGGMFYSIGSGELSTNTELVYFDMVRWFGLIPAMIVFLFLLYPLFIFVKNRDAVTSSCYIGYMIISGTNPLLMSSTGMLAMVYFFISTLNKNRMLTYHNLKM